jgi:hypothetical protein
MDRILFDCFKRLERFLRRHCATKIEDCPLRPLGSGELKFLVEAMRYCREKMPQNVSRTMIKLVRGECGEKVRLPKDAAVSLYRHLMAFVSQKSSKKRENVEKGLGCIMLFPNEFPDPNKPAVQP